MGHSTGYGYDGMGRLNRIAPPGGYAATSIAWYPNSSSGWSRVTTTGSASSSDTYDAFLHPVTTTDSAGHNYSRRFDADGNATFVSYPGGGSYGFTMSYDGLDRMRTSSDADGHTISTDYYANQIVVENRNGHQTTTRYQAFDEPTTASPTSIQFPDGNYTSIERDLWGQAEDHLPRQRGAVDRL